MERIKVKRIIQLIGRDEASVYFIQAFSPQELLNALT